MTELDRIGGSGLKRFALPVGDSVSGCGLQMKEMALGGTTCLTLLVKIRPHLFHVFFVASSITIICNIIRHF